LDLPRFELFAHPLRYEFPFLLIADIPLIVSPASHINCTRRANFPNVNLAVRNFVLVVQMRARALIEAKEIATRKERRNEKNERATCIVLRG
jgi:hypothetical protein